METPLSREPLVPLVDADAVAEAAAEVFVAAANAAVDRDGRFIVALALELCLLLPAVPGGHCEKTG